MKHNHTVQQFLGLLVVLMLASCGGEAVPPADTAQVVGLIQQDARAIADNPDITNDMALLDMEGRTNNDPNRGGIFDNPESNQTELPMPQEPLITQAPPEPMPMDEAPPKVTPAAAPRPRPKAPAQAVRPMAKGSYIKVGNDRGGQRVSPRRTQKITVVLQTGNAVSSDITLYAVPAGSARPAMNANTLIGFAKNFDAIGGRVQFTRYWNASVTKGTFLRAGNYNIYFTYTHRDARGRILSSGGRYWGGGAPISIRVE